MFFLFVCDVFIHLRFYRFMHFGKREDEETDAVVNDAVENELIKRSSNRFMHFGKRAGTQRWALLLVLLL